MTERTGRSALVAVPRPRTVLRAWGRDPVKMVQGLATADLARLAADRAVYTAFLTPKGKMVADARVLLRPGDHDPSELLLLTDPAAAPGLLDHFRKFIPPLFSRFEDVTDAWRAVGVYGDGASDAARVGLGAATEPAAGSPGTGPSGGQPRPDAPEDTVVVASAEPPALAIRTGEVGGDGWELLVAADRGEAVLAALGEAGAASATEAELEARRIAAGRPRWGAELTPDVIPIEAGLLDRAISQSKGCYTGQEVIVRILHRGHVNRHLRALTFPEGVPAPGTELYEPGRDRPRGMVTSTAAAEDGDGGQGLGYVRREIEPPAEMRAGGPEGPVVRVTALP